MTGTDSSPATADTAALTSVRPEAAPRQDPPPRPGATLALTSVATAVALMTYTAPIVTLPDTAAALHTPLSAQAWLLNGTPLGLAALLLVAGSLADDYGRRRIFVSGTLALGITTALGALATTTWLFTLARVAQGAASAALLASSLGLIVHAFPTPGGRLRATGVWGAFVTGGIAVGPLARRLAGRVPTRVQLAIAFVLHAGGVLTMLGAVGAGSTARFVPGMVVAGVGSGLLNAALPLLAVESVPPARAAMGSGAQQTFRYIGSCAGVALTIAVATSSSGGVARGTDIAMVVSAVLALVAAVAVVGLRERA
ncbi:MFS transporter [Streptomyces marokkonensis]|uniref:MFS transporter n=1 Tax=Streptomyces marokkonensis TaxID=324855 RepID=A0ABW6QEE3_9ACTN